MNNSFVYKSVISFVNHYNRVLYLDIQQIKYVILHLLEILCCVIKNRNFAVKENKNPLSWYIYFKNPTYDQIEAQCCLINFLLSSLYHSQFVPFLFLSFFMPHFLVPKAHTTQTHEDTQTYTHSSDLPHNELTGLEALYSLTCPFKIPWET